MKLKLPRYVKAYIDRDGKARFYFRRTGFKSVTLPGLPWAPAFMEAYERAMAGQPAAIGAAHVVPGSMHALAISYYSSPTFLGMRRVSQQTRRNIIERFCRETDANGLRNGDKRAAILQREHIIRFMAARSVQPESANGLRKAIRALMQHAIDIGLRTDDPTRDVKAIRVKSVGYHSWTEDEIAQFEARHPIGSRPRLALALLLFSGQRRSDVVHMGRQHIRDGFLHVRQVKTGAELAIRVHSDLQSIIAKTVVGQMTFLVTELGKPFTAAGFGNWFREQCDMANLRHCSSHGLRKAAARRLAEAGCTAHEIAAITGHASLYEITRYTRAADQKRLAEVAIEKVERAKKRTASV
jgi:site-specific recombinase XerD